MKVVVQRSKNSKVTIDGKVNGSIEHGFVLLSSFTDTDTLEIVDKMIDKILNLIRSLFLIHSFLLFLMRNIFLLQ